MYDAGRERVEFVKIDRIKELAAGFASGDLEEAEHAEFRSLLQTAPAEAQAEAARIVDAAALISLSLPREFPSPALKDRILSRAQPPKPTPELFEFLRGNADTGWIPIKVPGAYVKLLSIQREKGYAVVLGKLDPQTHYPAHHHIGPEQLFVLEGDLHIGDVELKAGDFHNAKAGSSHGVN